MFRSVILFFCVPSLFCSSIAIHAQKDEKANEDGKRLEGIWQVTKLIDESGKPAPYIDIKELTFEFKGAMLTIRKDKKDAGMKSKYSLDQSKSPKWFEFEVPDLAPLGATLGIYKLERDDLEICLGPDFKSEKSARPSEFKASKTSTLFFLTRMKK